MEYCSLGSLLRLMKKQLETLVEEEIAEVCKQILEALAYLHESKKIHRDVKCANILLNHRGETKLCTCSALEW